LCQKTNIKEKQEKNISRNGKLKIEKNKGNFKETIIIRKKNICLKMLEVSVYLVVQHQISNLITLDQEHLPRKRSKLVSELVKLEET